MNIRRTCIGLLFAVLCHLPPSLCAVIIVENGDKVAFLGDSITAGGEAYGGYCRLVTQGLKTVGIETTPIFAGVPGNTSAHMLLRLQQDGLDHKPDIVFVSAGVNDVWHTDPTAKIGVFKPEPGMGVELKDYQVYLPLIVDRCTAAGAKVILSSITPIREDPETPLNKKAEAYNAFLKQLARERNLPIAELRDPMFAEIAKIKAEAAPGRYKEGGNILTSDGVHPGERGHQVMARGVLKSMGFTEIQLDQVEKNWRRSPKLLIMGGSQIYAGGRTGGWLNMLLDGMNLGAEMVTHESVGGKTLGEIAGKIKNGTSDFRGGYALLAPPIGDVDGKVPLASYQAILIEMVETLRAKDVKLVIATIASPAGNGEGALAIDSYNHVIREVCGKYNVPVADIGAAVRSHMLQNPDSSLFLEGNHFNHQGGTMMAECGLNAFAYPKDHLPRLKSIWDERESYTFKSRYRADIRIPLTAAGKNALADVRRRFHGIKSDALVERGLYELLSGDPALNRKRMAAFDAGWTAAEPNAADVLNESFGFMPSVVQGRRIASYLDQEKIDLSDLYGRALKVGFILLAHENPLGRPPAP